MAQALTSATQGGQLLHVEDAGGNGQPVFLQHGLLGDANQTREAFPNQPGFEQRFRRLTLECRGHGQSAAGNTLDFSIAAFTTDLIQCIEALQAGAVIAGGISMGAAIALRLAVTRPDLVKALILIRPAWIVASTPPNMAPNALVGELLSQHPPRQAHQLFLESTTAKHLAQAAPDNLKSLESFFDREPHTVTAALLTRISADGPGVTESQVRALSIPTLVIGTALDFIHPVAYAQTLADLIPSATLKVVTAKAISKALYLAGIHSAITQFLEEHP